MKTSEFRVAFAELAEKERLARTPVPVEIAIHLDYLFEPELFSKGNGNYGVASAILTISAAKALCPQLNATLFSDAKPVGYPSLRSLGKPVAEWVRRNIDPALIGADPGAGIRRNLMHDSPFDRNYGGSFADPVLRGAFLDLIERIEMGDALFVFRDALHRYMAMARRLPITPITDQISEQTALWWIDQYLSENRSHRAQAVVWAVASEADPKVSWNKTLNSNDHDQVGDVNGYNYAIETTTVFATTSKVQDLCLKARKSGRCERVTLVIAQDRVYTNDAEYRNIQATITNQFSDLEVNLITLDDYLHRMVSGYGMVTWTSVCQRIGREVQNLNPRDSNAWNMLVAQRQPVVIPDRRPCNLPSRASMYTA